MNIGSWYARQRETRKLLLHAITALAGFLAISAAHAQQPLFTADFGGSSGSTPAQWQPAGEAAPGHWIVNDGKLESGDGDDSEGLSWLVIDTPESTNWRNTQIASAFTMQQEIGQVALAVRWQDVNNYYAAVLQSFRRPGRPDIETQVEIIRVEDGLHSSLEIATNPGDVDLPDFYNSGETPNPHEFAFSATDNQLIALLDGNQVLSAKDGALRTGTAAVGQAYNSVFFDNVRVAPSDGGTGLSRPEELLLAAAPTSTPAPVNNTQFAPIYGGGDITQIYQLVMMDRQTLGDGADGLMSDLSNYPVKKITHGDNTVSILIGPYDSRAEAESVQNELMNQGFLVLAIREETLTSTPPVAEIFPTSTPADLPRPTATPVLIAETTEPPAPTATPAAIGIPTEQIASLKDAANRAEEARNFEEARGYWGSIMRIVPEGDDYEEARGNFDRLSLIMREDTQAQVAEEEGSGLLTYVTIGVAVVLLILIALIILILRNKKRGEELRKRIDQLSAVPAQNPAPAQTASAPAPAASPAAAPLANVGAQERIRPGTMSPAPGASKPASQAGPPAQQRQPSSQGVPRPATGVKTPPKPGVPPTPQRPGRPPTPPAPGQKRPSSSQAHIPTPPATPSPQQDEEEGLKLDFLFDDRQAQATPPPESGATPEPVVRREPSTEFIIPPQPDVVPAAAPPTGESAPSPVPVKPTNSSDYYLQNFDEEQVGQTPQNWRGQYDYASLTVVEDDSDGTARKCLRFEKKNGVGSAYYSCKFPNATGRIGVEFDIRCDDKNKYLLGFYIEKDEDFRQSIHTIVHRTNSSANPTLRIQNESTPYEFGKWTHIKFEIDLPRQVIDGYADDKMVAVSARLNSAPKAINTLSIRDNLATTGVLLIDNIRIYRL